VTATSATAIDPIAHARDLHRRFYVRAPEDIDLERIAAACGAFVVWRATGPSDARVVRAGDVAYLAIADHAQGTPRARFSIAHELGHHLMHRDVDALERIHGRPRTRGVEHQVERQADRFATELLLPAALLTPWCEMPSPTLDHVFDVARTFEVSLTAMARRWAELAPTPCACVESKDGTIVRATRSPTFRGVAVQRRKLVPGGWGREGLEVVERSVAIADGRLLTWLTH
jgi:hypothetical protein